jgi:hypothetical protein
LPRIQTQDYLYEGTPLWCVPVERVRIPADTCGLKPGTFGYHSLEFDTGTVPKNLKPEGPVRIEVDPGNTRYISMDGSLVAADGTLLSVWYENVTDLLDVEQHKTITRIRIPDGVERLAEKSIPFHSGRDGLVLDLPDSLIEICTGTLRDERIRQVNLGPDLVSVADDFWTNVSDDDPGRTRALRLRPGCHVTIHPLNRRFRIEKGCLVLPPVAERYNEPASLPARKIAYGCDRLASFKKDLLETLETGDELSVFPATDPDKLAPVVGVGTPDIGIAALLDLDPASIDFTRVRATVGKLVRRSDQAGRFANPVLEVRVEEARG